MTDPVVATAETAPKAKPEPGNDAPTAQPEAKKPEADKPKADNPEADTPGNDQPKATETKAGDPPADGTEPGTIEPAKDEPKDEAPADQGDEQPAPDQPAVTESPAEEPETGALTTAPQEKTKKKPAEPTTGELVVVKAILPAGSSDPADATPGGAGWKFTASSSTGTLKTPSSASTGADSSASFSITLAEGRLAPVKVTEAVRDGYSYVKAQCVLADGKQTPVAHTELDGAAFKVDVKTKKTTICVVFNRADEKPLKALKAKKTANPFFDRDYDWTIEKSVIGEQSVRVTPGEPATFDYQVVATPSAAQDSNFHVTGTITITNPNKVPVPVTVTDDLGIDGATCTITDADNTTVPASGTLTLTYECQLTQATATTTGKNTAVVTWDGGTVTATARFAFTPETANVTDRTVQLSDTAQEFGGTRTLDALDGPQTFTYSRTLGADVTSGTCQTFPNTASITKTTDQPELTDHADVTVCADTAVLDETDEEGDSGSDTDLLANTGSETDGLLGLAGLTVAGGVLLLWLGRRRPDEDAAA
ncbi:MAG: LPXTG cell wall anchor domain-containing protein [Propionicimonas sp.]